MKLFHIVLEFVWLEAEEERAHLEAGDYRPESEVVGCVEASDELSALQMIKNGGFASPGQWESHPPPYLRRFLGEGTWAQLSVKEVPKVTCLADLKRILGPEPKKPKKRIRRSMEK
jgi:hypothetical protein